MTRSQSDYMVADINGLFIINADFIGLPMTDQLGRQLRTTLWSVFVYSSTTVAVCEYVFAVPGERRMLMIIVLIIITNKQNYCLLIYKYILVRIRTSTSIEYNAV